MDLVLTDNGQIKTTSKIIADVFGKAHRKILRDIESLDCSEEFRAANFGLSYYTSQQNKKLTCYDITEDGFYFLCMGFTGKKAAKWKESFIHTFKEMKKALSDVDSRIIKLEQEAKKIKIAGSQWSKMGHEINRVKKGHLLEVQKVMDEVQMKLEF
jgi:Rha family phage regulatory protein